MNSIPVMDPERTSGYRIHEIHLSGEDGLTAVVEFLSESHWFAGHFPGKPVLPGIAQMGTVFDLMKQGVNPCLKLEEFKRVRFKQLIKPDTPITVLVEPQDKIRGLSGFRLMVNGEVSCSGLIRVSRQETSW